MTTNSDLIAEYKVIQTGILNDFKNGVSINSWSVANQSFTYSSVLQRQQLLDFIDRKIKELSPNAGGMFQLARFG